MEILEKYVGTDLEGKEYIPLYDGAAKAAQKQHKKAFYVLCDTYVTLTDGTGVVHIAPHSVRTMPRWDAAMICHLYSL